MHFAVQAFQKANQSVSVDRAEKAKATRTFFLFLEHRHVLQIQTPLVRAGVPP